MQEDFISQITAVVEKNIEDEQFGVSELADMMNMSRSNLLRKIKKQTGLSASQFIRKVRLEIAMDLLKEETYTVSEVSYKVGFGSTSYFIKCFREQYGHPPGEVNKQKDISAEVPEKETQDVFPVRIVVGSILVIAVVLIGFFVLWSAERDQPIEIEKSIAVLPFKNESSDSTNLYFINGLMESTLNNLQKIQDLRVISRTSVEKYRNTDRSIPEISRELNVNYFVEGSGQKIGDQVLLNIQLIDASTDKHIWAEQYSRKVADVFALQNEVATKIAEAIEAIVTPEELEQIEKIPTENLVAYDYYLQAQDYFLSRTAEGLEAAIPLFEQAIEHDPEFDLAYAHIAISYYFLDMYRVEKHYTEEINYNADQALLYDSRSPVSLLAKAFYYIHTEEYRLAVPHLEKALEYNPNSSGVIQTLSDLYARFIPNTAKYLEYALKGVQLDIAPEDSIQRSYIYLHLSNALAQTGFLDESLKYINLSLDFNPENEYSSYVRALILYGRDGDMDRTQKILIRELEKDTTRLDVRMELAKVYYFEQQYDSAYFHYKRFVRDRKLFGLDIFPNEDGKIGFVYKKMGFEEEAEEFFNAFAEFSESDQSIYRGVNMALKYAHEGKIELGMEQLKQFSAQDNIQYWILLFLESDPLIDPLKEHPDYDETIRNIENRFLENQVKLKKSLEEKGVM